MSEARVLVAGWVNSPHVLAWADAVRELGYEVHLAGEQVGLWPPPEDTGRFASVTALEPGTVPGIRDRRLGRALGRVARETRPDLVHAHWVPGYGWLAAKAGLRPLVTSAWGSDVLCASARLKLRGRRALRASTLVLADSDHLAGAARRLAARDIWIEVIQWGVDLSRYRPDAERRAAARRRLGLDERPTVLTTRALDPLYNPGVLLRAFALLHRAIPDARLVLKHPGASLPEEIQTELEELDLVDAVVTLGFVDEDELADVYRAADLYVSIPSSDSSPRSVWEALACGTPAIVSDLPWARESLEDGNDALLVAIDPKAVADSMHRVLTDGQAAARLSQSGRRVAATMDRREVIARLDRLYRTVLARTS